MKKLLLAALTTVCLTAMSDELEDAYAKIPEIMNNHEKVIDVVWNLSKTNRLSFITAMNRAIHAYGVQVNYPNSKLRELHREFDRYYYIATNPAAPTTSLRVDWHKQLMHQNMLGLKDVSVRSDPETTDFNRDSSNPSGVEIITSPFFRAPFPRSQLIPAPYYE